MKAANLKPISEKAFMAQVIQLARLCGWMVYHTFDSRHSAKGFPDLVLARGPGHAIRLVVAELKLSGKGATVEQYAWLGAFQGAGVQTFLWSPDDWAEIEAVLRGE